MKLSTNLIFQGAALLIQYGTQASVLIPEKYRTYIALTVGLAQALVAWHAQHVNPDGTPAATPYVKK
jgi:hypothetical protein